MGLKDPDKYSVDADNIQEYRFCRVPFGVISGPFLLGATVNYHLDTYGSALAQQIKGDIYMDNVVTGTHSVCEAISLYTDCKKMFSNASMNLREWASNDKELEANIPEQDKSNEKVMKVLGLNWTKKEDCLSLKKIKQCDVRSI